MKLVLLCLLLAFSASADNGTPPPLLLALEKIELAEKSKVEIAKILKADREQGHALMEELAEARFLLTAVIRDHDATEDDVRKAAKNLAAVEEKLALAIYRTGHKILRTLSAEQKKQIREVKVDPSESGALSTAEAVGEKVEEWIEKYGSADK